MGHTESNEYKFFKIRSVENSVVREFLYSLDNRTIYGISPFISISYKVNDPIIMLSQEIAITKYNDSLNLTKYLNNQFNKAVYDFNIDIFDNYTFNYTYTHRVNGSRTQNNYLGDFLNNSTFLNLK